MAVVLKEKAARKDSFFNADRRQDQNTIFYLRIRVRYLWPPCTLYLYSL